MALKINLKNKLRVSSCAVRGPAGESAYEIAVGNGYTGTEVEWLASLKGDTGDTGPTGPVATVNSQSPDGDGDVTVNAAHVPYQSISAIYSDQPANVDDALTGLEAYNTANYRLAFTTRDVLSTNFIPRSTIATGKTKVGDILVDPRGNFARITKETTVNGVNGWQIMALGNRIAEDPINIAPTYSSSDTYAVGDCVHYAGVLYRCTSAISTAEAWDSDHWTQTTVMAELVRLTT